MKQIKMSSAIIYLMVFDVVREWISLFICYRKYNYFVEYLQLTEPLFLNCQFFLIRVLNKLKFSILILAEFLPLKHSYIC